MSSSYQAGGAFEECYMQSHTEASPGQCCQFSPSPHICLTDPRTLAGLVPLASVQQALGYPAPTGAPVPTELSRVQVY